MFYYMCIYIYVYIRSQFGSSPALASFWLRRPLRDGAAMASSAQVELLEGDAAPALSRSTSQATPTGCTAWAASTAPGRLPTGPGSRWTPRAHPVYCDEHGSAYGPCLCCGATVPLRQACDSDRGLAGR